MEVFEEGSRSPILLNNDDFMDSGGEAEIYVKGKTAYKIYHDQKKAIPEAKIRELQVLKDSRILAPKKIVTTSKGVVLGFSMDLAKHTIPLPKLFSPLFKRKNGIGVRQISALLKNMQEVITYIHKHDCLIIDGNEMNYVVDEQRHTKPYFLDVDSFKTKNFPGTAFHPLTKDYSVQGNSPLTDWYSFSIVAFKLFTGVHPFRGNHKDYARGDIEGKMRNLVSVFSPNVSLPPSATALSEIPTNYLLWFRALYTSNSRHAPPGLAGEIITLSMTMQKVASCGKITISLINHYTDTILHASAFKGKILVETTKKLYLDRKSVATKLDSLNKMTLFSPILLRGEVVYASISNGVLALQHPTEKIIQPILIPADDFFVIDNELFYVDVGKIVHLQITVLSGKITASSGSVWNTLAKSSKIFENVVYQNTLGSCYLYVPFVELSTNSSACGIVNIVELRNAKVLSGKRVQNVVMLATSDAGVYRKHTLKFNEDFSKYSLDTVETAELSALNFTVTDTGTMVHITDNAELEVSKSKYGANRKLMQLKDPAITTALQIFSANGKVYVSDENTLKQLSLSA